MKIKRTIVITAISLCAHLQGIPEESSGKKLSLKQIFTSYCAHQTQNCIHYELSEEDNKNFKSWSQQDRTIQEKQIKNFLKKAESIQTLKQLTMLTFLVKLFDELKSNDLNNAAISYISSNSLNSKNGITFAQYFFLTWSSDGSYFKEESQVLANAIRDFQSIEDHEKPYYNTLYQLCLCSIFDCYNLCWRPYYSRLEQKESNIKSLLNNWPNYPTEHNS